MLHQNYDNNKDYKMVWCLSTALEILQTKMTGCVQSIMATVKATSPLGPCSHRADYAKNQLQHIIIRVPELQRSLNAQPWNHPCQSQDPNRKITGPWDPECGHLCGQAFYSWAFRFIVILCANSLSFLLIKHPLLVQKFCKEYIWGKCLLI